MGLNGLLEMRIFVFGPGSGEAIIISFPDDSVGIIDSFAPSSLDHDDVGKYHPVIQFVDSVLQPKTIRFLFLTHFHADHCRGFAAMVSHFQERLKYLLLPEEITNQNMRLYYDQLRKHDFDPSEVACGLDRGTIHNEIEDVFSFLESSTFKPQYKFIDGDRPPIIFPEIQVSLQFLTPLSPTRVRFQRSALSGLTPEPRRIDPNLVCPALKLKFGETILLFCADVVKEGWDAYFDANTETLEKEVQFLKVGHHGSENGLPESLLSFLGESSSRIGILTPFNGGSSHLPSKEGMEKISRICETVFTTQKDLSRDSSGFCFLNSQPGVPSQVKVVEEFGKDPDLRNFSARKSADGGISVFIPKSAVKKIANNPYLRRAFSAGLSKIPSSPTPEDSLVSVSFDNRGNQITSKTSLGSLAGEIRKGKGSKLTSKFN